jgi:hypothetical protein
MTDKYALPTVIFLTLTGLSSADAQTITNGNFEGGTTGWGCIVEIGTAPTYGGTGTGHVAEVDGNFSTASTDDRVLCQSVSGFTVGSVYSIAFDATRRGNGTPPATVSVGLTLDGGALDRTITRTGGYSMVHEGYNFTATQTTHALLIAPLFTSSYGMIFDNLTITLVSALPIELLYFKARPEEDNVSLSWATATEHNNDLFIVERSSDGILFSEVLRIQGAGNSTEETDYVEIDPAPLTGRSYYRLKQVDFDGATEVFDLAASWFEPSPTSGISLFPNPAADGRVWLSVSGAIHEGPVSVVVRDSAGRSVFAGDVPLCNDLRAIELNPLVTLRPGAYSVLVTSFGRSDAAQLLVP